MIAPDAMIAGFKRLLSGGSLQAGRNPLLAVLGMDTASVKEIVDSGGNLAEELVRRINAKAGDVPDSWHSALTKLKEDLSEALGSGVISTFGQGSDAMKNFTASFKDPAFLASLKVIGEDLGKIAIAIGVIVGFVTKKDNSVANWLGDRIAGVSLAADQSPEHQDAVIAAIRAKQLPANGLGPQNVLSAQFGSLDTSTVDLTQQVTTRSAISARRTSCSIRPNRPRGSRSCTRWARSPRSSPPH